VHMEAEPFDAVVIGSGQGDTPLSIALAKAGLKTAIVERKHFGGTCVFVFSQVKENWY
jgi:pyruvate/2-oxoglutarate dehydrogenase complex dihydrolipoamide dehydrogenase (E3) component